MTSIHTSVVDQPIEVGHVDNLQPLLNEDLLGIYRYESALKEFIRRADTPLTIALQGEWGSGKTSLMNLLRCDLTENDATFYRVWINTWQHAMLKTPGEAILGILSDIVNQLEEHAKKSHALEKAKNTLKALGVIAINFFGRYAAGEANASTIMQNGWTADELAKAQAESQVAKLKKAIEELIQEILSSKNNQGRQGVLFFIDDLDRIDPPLAVQLLELLKNVFDLKNCIYILAIDYDVVIKGLKPKYGEHTEENDREFRSFFDKIIQLPFTMPTADYQVKTFLRKALEHISFLTSEELIKAEVLDELAEMTMHTVGPNPRSLKRLTNFLSLINLMNESYGENQLRTTMDKEIHFALVCLQITYPSIYNMLKICPDMYQWPDRLKEQMAGGQKISGEASPTVAGQNADPWEDALHYLCARNSFLRNHEQNVKELLKQMEDIVQTNSQGQVEQDLQMPDQSKQSNLGEVVGRLIQLSDVTNVQASANEFVKPEDFSSSDILKRHRDLFLPAVNGLLQGSGIKVENWSDRVRTQVQYKIINPQSEKPNEAKQVVFHITAGHDEKRYFLKFWHDCTYLRQGKEEQAREEELLECPGRLAEVKRALEELQKEYPEPGCAFAQADCYRPGEGLWWFAYRHEFYYSSLEMMVSRGEVERFARFMNKYLRILDRLYPVMIAKER